MFIVKTLTLTAISVLISTISIAQLKVTNNAFQQDLQKVINDYPNHFRNLLGEIIETNPQSTDYMCTVKISGAENCTITQYTAVHKEVFSWNALMLTTEEYDEALKKYKSLYSQIKGLKVTFRDALPIVLKGDYEEPLEERKFTSVIFTGQSETLGDQWDKLKIELVMQYEFPEWKVKVLVYDKEREDDERGEIIEGKR